jgi:trimeric autotransporter adhesin
MTTLSIRNSIKRLPSRCDFLLAAMLLSFGWLAMSPIATGQDCNDGCDFLFGNTFQGEDALFNNGVERNTAFGAFTLYSDISGSDNTATGQSALFYNTNGNSNTASGSFGLFNNTTGSRNVADGFSALYSNQTGSDNTATGYNALYANTANYNTATGYQALESNTTGTNNSAHGIDALNTNTTGSSNTANGALALFNNTTGANNTANGFDALYYNTTGPFNTANGFQALFNNTIGANNTADGVVALASNTTGGNNIAVGFQAGFNLTTGSNNIDIGNAGVTGESAKIRIGTKPTHKNTYIAGIFGVTVPTGLAVLVDNSGHLGTTTSSARFKEGIQPMDKASEAILALKPVTFRYKKELDPDGNAQFGLVAEEVEKVDPDLVTRDDEGKPYTVRYEAVNAMLLNEFLKEHRKVEQEALKNRQQEATISELRSALAQQQAEIATLSKSFKDQAAQFGKLNANLAINESPQHLVANDQ